MKGSEVKWANLRSVLNINNISGIASLGQLQGRNVWHAKCAEIYASLNIHEVMSLRMNIHTHIHASMFYVLPYLNMSSSHHSIDNQYHIHRQNFQ